MKACKVFEVKHPLTAKEIYDSLHGYTQLWEEELDGRSVAVGFRVAEVEESGDAVRGVAEESWIRRLVFRGEEMRVPASIQIPFTFIVDGRQEFLLVYASRRYAERLAARFSEILFDRHDMILDLMIPPEKLREIYSRAAEVRSMVMEVNVAGVRKVTLFGRELVSSRIVKSYISRYKGRESYVMYRDEVGVFGVSVSAQIVAFSRISDDDFEAYIREIILPRVEPPPEEEVEEA